MQTVIFNRQNKRIHNRIKPVNDGKNENKPWFIVMFPLLQKYSKFQFYLKWIRGFSELFENDHAAGRKPHRFEVVHPSFEGERGWAATFHIVHIDYIYLNLGTTELLSFELPRLQYPFCKKEATTDKEHSLLQYHRRSLKEGEQGGGDHLHSL